ncbi:hypothetical protein Fisuc_1129 [Fibrobacter succinogenes subsp. succinogenes S85]|uniref:Uncharacterized protein n=1 Tax=Fibrobacter succinogenes (strain ATCC 19169 / S85) TaxID=59374 RepID=A0ABN3YT74_FIBSS|nr:hypothetical protein [Fibrobacter succinogenes]ACX74733.1 hypothetical protein Fisuc_1129 [Fibrobacter succinogenes subsp. succinogenes S85]
MTARNVTVENEVVEHSWTADCIRAGSVDEIVLAVRAFAEDIERMARENLDGKICVDCRAGTFGAFKMRSLSQLDDQLMTETK